MKTCNIDGCENPLKCKGLCSMHYQRQRIHGDTGGAAPLPRTGASNSNWRGGRRRGGHQGRYWMAYAPDHPHAVLEHRLVMEQHLGRLLDPAEVVHHINLDPLDNRIENLAVMTQAEHVALHNRLAVAS